MGMLEAPHDTLFRSVFRHAAVAGSWLKSVLPRRIARAIDWNTLAQAAGTAFGVRLHRHEADLVFTATLRKNGTQVLIVIEHKAQHDPALSAQVLRYVVHLQHALRRARTRPVPLVLAVVLHHGPLPLASPHSQLDGLPGDVAAAFAARQPHLPLVTDDLALHDERELFQRGLHPLAQLGLLCLRFLRTFTDEQVLAALNRWRHLLLAAEAEYGTDTTDAVSLYAIAVSDVDPEALADTIARILNREEDTLMSTLERTYLRGRAEAILRMLSKRFGPLAKNIQQRVHAASIEDLDRWTDRILEAKTLDEVFAT